MLFSDWVAATPLSQAMQTIDWIIPSIQAVHIVGIAVVFTSAVVLDMRILGVMGRSQSMVVLTRRFAPWIGWGVLLLAITGVVLIVGEPTRAPSKPLFWVKMAALLLAGGLTWRIAALVKRRPDAWLSPETTISAKLVAVVSLALWLLIIWAGRWIAYT